MIQIITKDDLDGKTIQVNDEGKVFAVLPSGNGVSAEDEFEVVHNATPLQPDDQFYVKREQVTLKHKATEAIFLATSVKKMSRGTPLNEQVSQVRVSKYDQQPAGGDAYNFSYEVSYVSSIDGQRRSMRYDRRVENNENAQQFNQNRAVTLTTEKRYAEREPYQVINPTSFAIELPEEELGGTGGVGLNMDYTGDLDQLTFEAYNSTGRNIDVISGLRGSITLAVVPRNGDFEEFDVTLHASELGLSVDSRRININNTEALNKINAVQDKEIKIKSSDLILVTFNGDINLEPDAIFAY